jgi:hypothetical protein
MGYEFDSTLLFVYQSVFEEFNEILIDRQRR